MAELRRIFVPPEDFRGDRLLLAGERLRHVRTVLRLGPGDECSVTDGAGAEYRVMIEQLGKETGRAAILQRTEPQREPGLVTWLALAVPKGDRFAFVLEKAVELGVSGVIPVLSRRTVRAPRAEAAASARWRRIVEGAVAQSGRTRVPAMRSPTPLEALLGDRNLPGLRILLWEQASAGLRGLIEGCAPPPAVLVAVGPEGGWSPEEAQQAQAAGFLPARLGPRILRTDTAAIAALALLQHRWGDLG